VKVCEFVNKKKFNSKKRRLSSTCKYFPTSSSSCDIIISDHRRHPLFGHQSGPSSSTIDISHCPRGSPTRAAAVVEDRDRLRSSSSPAVSLKSISELNYNVSRFTDRWKIVFVEPTSFTSHVYPVGTDFEYFGNGLASLYCNLSNFKSAPNKFCLSLQLT